MIWFVASYILLIAVIRKGGHKTVAQAAAEQREQMEARKREREKERVNAAASAYLGIPGAEKVPVSPGPSSRSR